jgi:hypothetical protein
LLVTKVLSRLCQKLKDAQPRLACDGPDLC